MPAPASARQWCVEPARSVSDRLNVTGSGASHPVSHVDGSSVDCNQSNTLTIADFGCFQSKFAGGDPYADCNQSSTLTIADFGCFQAKFATGCP